VLPRSATPGGSSCRYLETLTVIAAPTQTSTIGFPHWQMDRTSRPLLDLAQKKPVETDGPMML
jgi:hypothetical protein